jgi:hypothetical protein
MDVLASNAVLQFRAPARASARQSASSAFDASTREKAPTTTGGLPDSAYWTAYDHYMIERKARADRRAYVYSKVATLVRRLRQSIASFRSGQALQR